MSDSDLMKLYSGQILALAADIPHLGRLPHPDATACKRAPLCGSVVTVDIGMQAGRITAFAQDVKACALGQAAAAVLGQVVIGLDRPAIEAGRHALRAMLAEGGPVPAPPFQAFAALQAARDFKNRHASILLALDATCEAAAQAETRQNT